MRSRPPDQLPARPGPGLHVFINQVFLEAVTGSPGVQSIPIPASFSGISAPWRAEFQTVSGGDWLSLSVLQGTGEGSFRVYGNTATMKNGTYNAKITITGRESTPSSVTPQRIAVRMEGETTPNWTLSATTLNGGPWLSVSPAAGKGNGEFVVTPSPANLAPGVYSGRVTLLAPGATNSGVQLPVLFSIDRQSAAIAPRGIVNAASLLPGPIAPGGLITIAGERLGPRNGITARPNPGTGRFTTSLGGTRILFDTTPGALLYVSANQVNVEVPVEVATRKSVKITVETPVAPPPPAYSLPMESAPSPSIRTQPTTPRKPPRQKATSSNSSSPDKDSAPRRSKPAPSVRWIRRLPPLSPP